MADVPHLTLCPTWHRPLFRITPEGIEIKCKFCGGVIHKISREEIEQQWKAMVVEAIALSSCKI